MQARLGNNPRLKPGIPAAIKRTHISSVVPPDPNRTRGKARCNEVMLPEPRIEHDPKLHDAYLNWLIRRDGFRKDFASSPEWTALRSALVKLLLAELPTLSPARAKGITERMLLDLHESEHTWLGTGPSSVFLHELVASTIEGLTT